MFDTVYLTGFKKFGNVKVNPTQLIVDQLLKDPVQNVHPEKLDVTTQEVDSYIKKICESLKNSQKRVLHIHFGVGPNKVYFLENCGYNKKDFSIPDNSGKICKNEQICKKMILDEPLKTNLNLQQLCSKLGKKHEVQISTDPGRYLCNYVYFNSLNDLRCNQNQDCLFVHFPNQDHKTHQQNMKFVKDLLKLVLKN